MPQGKNIETGVDKLVDLINKKKKISLNDAAKELGVSIPVIQEWADFLEDEGLISVEDRLSTTYLAERKLNKTEVEKKAKEYVSKKDSFIASVENALSSLQKEAEGLSRIKSEFEKLKDAIGGDIDFVKEELAELKHYEELKKNMDKEILQQRLDYQAMIDETKRNLTLEKKKYESFLDGIGGEKSKIDEAKVELSFLLKKQENLQKRMDAIKEIHNSIQSDIEKQKLLIADSLRSMDTKVKESEQVRKDLKLKMELEMGPIVKKMKDNEERILAVQNSVLQKIMAKHKEIDQYKLKSTEAAEKLKDFFDRRTNMQEMITTLEKDKTEIEHELNDLINKARAFDLSTKSSDSKKFIKELQDSLHKVENKKSSMKDRIGKLTDLIRKKE